MSRSPQNASPHHQVTPPLPNRRVFLQAAAAGGAGLTLSFCSSRDSIDDNPMSDAPFAPNAYLRLTADGTVTIVVGQSELGQGVHTALAMVVAEELDADWERVKVQAAPAHPAYANPLMQTQRTAWSASVRGWWEVLRETGARARTMLLAEAAVRWGVTTRECVASDGVVSHPASQRQLGYGELADAAGLRAPPRRVRLKAIADFRLIGTSPRRLDTPPKVDGSLAYGVDVQRPGMVTASVAHPPALGSEPVKVDDGTALTHAGVSRVIQLPSAVAVLADTWWQAERGRRALTIAWSEPDAGADTTSVAQTLQESLTERGTVARSQGRVGRVLEASPQRLEARYATQFVAHATMEPMSCVAEVSGDRCEVWVPTQNQAGALEAAARVSGLAQDRITIHTVMAGGGFGRRLEQDFVEEAVSLAMTAGAPVKVMWTREDDMLHDVFKPMTAHLLAAGLDASGRMQAWSHQIAGGFGPDGANDLPYDIPNVHVEHRRPKTAVREGLWRSVDFSHNCFAVESFVDELANLAAEDPYRFRRNTLTDTPRHLAVLDRVAELSAWGATGEGRAQGLALTASHGSVVGQVVELHVVDGAVRIDSVVVVVDCGVVVHPDAARSQIEGAVAMGLSAALEEDVQLESGRSTARNFDSYKVLRFPRMPDVRVHFMESEEHPGGVGEIGIPPVAPALGNAIFRATGRRIRRLPYLRGGRLLLD